MIAKKSELVKGKKSTKVYEPPTTLAFITSSRKTDLVQREEYVQFVEPHREEPAERIPQEE